MLLSAELLPMAMPGENGRAERPGCSLCTLQAGRAVMGEAGMRHDCSCSQHSEEAVARA